MKKYTSNIPIKMKQYNIMLDLARNKNSTLYYPDGSQRMGASHRETFWKGYNGTYTGKFAGQAPTPHYIHYCIWRAGIDYRAEVFNKLKESFL